MAKDGLDRKEVNECRIVRTNNMFVISDTH